MNPSPSSPPFPPSGHTPRFRARIVPVICFTVFFSVLNGTMFNVAIPDIARQFRLGPAEVSWVLTGYVTVFALAAAVYGKLADRFPVRRLITMGLLLFNAGALLGLVPGPYLLLVAARLLQASGGGAIPALGMLAATRYFPPERRGAMLGTLASTVAFAAGLGPIVGGAIAGSWHWRYLFLLSLATLATLPFYARLLPEEPSREGRFDLGGAVLVGVGTGALLVAVTHLSAAAAVAWAGALGLFLRHLRRAAHPFVPAELLRRDGYRLGLAVTSLTVASVFAMFFLVPLLLRLVHHLPTGSIGLAIFPGAFSAALLGSWGGRLADRSGSGRVVFLGQGLLAGGYLGLAGFAGRGPLAVALCLVVCYTGFAFVQSSLAKTVSLTLPCDATGIGMGFYNLIFFSSGALGAAGSGKLLDLLTAAGPGPGEIAEVFRLLFLCAAAVVVMAAVLFRLVAARIDSG